MTPGIAEIITLLLGLGGFGADANPNAPTPDAALQYAMPNADVVVHFDMAVILPKNYAVLANLQNNAQIKASPDLVKMVRDATSQVESARGMAKTMVGFDPVTDLQDATVFAAVGATGEPTFVAQVHGKFSVALVDKIASMNGVAVIKVGGGEMIDMGNGKPALGVTKSGVLLAGTPNLVKARIADTWKMPARPANSALAMAQQAIASKPIFAVAIAMSPTAKARALKDQGNEKNFATDLLQRGKGMWFAVYADGIGWTWNDKTRAGAESMKQVSDGLFDLLRAAEIAPRGFAKIALGSIDSYKGRSKEIDQLIAHKADLMKIVETYTGDGSFTASVTVNPKTNTTVARATGKSLSEVVPLAAILPMVGLAVFTRSGVQSASVPVYTPGPVAPAPTPRRH